MSAIAPPHPSSARQETRPAHPGRQDSALLGRYTGPGLRAREIVSVPAAGASTLLIDRDTVTHLDERLVAHLASDEPAANRHLICAMYLADKKGRYCGRVTAQDRETTPPAVHVSSSAHAGETALDSEGIL
jgi:hypothetical protein